MLLRELRSDIQTLPGVGPATARAYRRLGVTSLSDLLSHMPRGYEDRLTAIPFSAVGAEGTVNTTITVVEHQHFYWRGRKTLKVIITDGTEPASLLCYGRNFLANMFVPGRRFNLYGHFQRRYGELSSASFDVEPAGTSKSSFGAVLPIYPLSGRLTQRALRTSVATILREHGHGIEDEIPEPIREELALMSMRESITKIHFPNDLEQPLEARRSLAYTELFYLQLIMQRRARGRRAKRSKTRSGNRTIIGHILDRLPFELTNDQRTVFNEIRADLGGGNSMMRLLQGDVGSGKTLVALLAAAAVTASGEQVALMVPTELLARQQAETAAQILEPVGVRIGFLTGAVKEAGRRTLIEAISNGDVDLIIGTHALFSKDVTFARLGLVVIDEQHRFGVLQRLAILEKGTSPDLLLMTATPIPRSLALTVFGDLDISTIRTMPKGRLPVRTHLARHGNEQKVYDRVRRELGAGHQAYFVYPLIEQSEKSDLKDAESMYDELSGKVFRDFRVGLIHSRVSEDDKRSRMLAFSRGEIDVLVATSVVEVGVDVPNATCMVIEHAERFGLAALHQLRGRVGRSDVQSYAFLMYDPEITETAKRRLMAMKETTDGFVIAEEDLKNRGPGELTGTHQTGELELRFADIVTDFELLKRSREDAMRILAEDPGFLRPVHAPVREVLTRCPPYSGDLTVSG